MPEDTKPPAPANVESIDFETVRFSDYLGGVVLLAVACGVLAHAWQVATNQPLVPLAARAAILMLAVAVATAILVGVVFGWRRNARIDVGPGWLRYTRRSPLGDFTRHWRLEEIDQIIDKPLANPGRHNPGPGIRLEFVGGGYFPIYTSTASENQRLDDWLTKAIARAKASPSSPADAAWILNSDGIVVEKKGTGVRLKLPRVGWGGRGLTFGFVGAVFALGAMLGLLLLLREGWPSSSEQWIAPAIAIFVASLGWLFVFDYVRLLFVDRELSADAVGVTVVRRGLLGGYYRRFATDELEAFDVGPYRLSSHDSYYLPQLLLFLKGGRVDAVALGEEAVLFSAARCIADVTKLPLGIGPSAQESQRPDVTIKRATERAQGFFATPAGCVVLFVLIAAHLTFVLSMQFAAGQRSYSDGRNIWFCSQPPQFWQASQQVPGIDFKLQVGWSLRRYKNKSPWRSGYVADASNRLEMRVWIEEGSPPASFARVDAIIECRSGPIEVYRAESTINQEKYAEYRLVGRGFGLGAAIPASDEDEAKPFLWEIARSLKHRAP